MHALHALAVHLAAGLLARLHHLGAGLLDTHTQGARAAKHVSICRTPGQQRACRAAEPPSSLLRFGFGEFTTCAKSLLFKDVGNHFPRYLTDPLEHWWRSGATVLSYHEHLCAITDLTTCNWQEQRESSSHLVEERRHFRWTKPWSEQARFNVPSNAVVRQAP